MPAPGGGPDAPHRPVLLHETVQYLAPERGGLFVDATLGLGGHSEALLEASPQTRVLGIDRDREALAYARRRLAHFGSRCRFAHANFRELPRVLAEAGEREVSGDLAELVARAVGRKRTDRIHPATRTFQALRIAVNRELEGLAEFIETSIDLLQPQGRLCVISFHSLEDRIVKRTLRRLSGHCECDVRAPVCSCGARRAVEILTRRPVTATDEEIEENARTRSAKLSAARKLGPNEQG